MRKVHVPAKTWFGAGFWLLAIGAAVLVNALLAVVLVVVGAVLVLMGLAGVAPIQRQAPGLGKLPLVYDHHFQVVPKDHAGPAAVGSAPASPSDDSRELLHLARLLRTELETCESRIQAARRTGRGWTSDRALPAHRFSSWSESLATASETDANEALSRFYVWADTMNHRMREREANEERNVGRALSLNQPGLNLSGSDQNDLMLGISLIHAADGALEASIAKRTA